MREFSALLFVKIPVPLPPEDPKVFALSTTLPRRRCFSGRAPVETGWRVAPAARFGDKEGGSHWVASPRVVCFCWIPLRGGTAPFFLRPAFFSSFLGFCFFSPLFGSFANIALGNVTFLDFSFGSRDSRGPRGGGYVLPCRCSGAQPNPTPHTFLT